MLDRESLLGKILAEYEELDMGASRAGTCRHH